jgi:hypothetical protein
LSVFNAVTQNVHQKTVSADWFELWKFVKVYKASETCGDHGILKNLWPPWSLDLISTDFYLWDYSKWNAYINNAHFLEEQNIHGCIAALS